MDAKSKKEIIKLCNDWGYKYDFMEGITKFIVYGKFLVNMIKSDKMATNDEIKWEIERLKYVINLARANERFRIRTILEKAFAENTFYKCLDCGIEYKGKIDEEHSADHTFTSRIVFESKSIKKLLAKIDEVG